MTKSYTWSRPHPLDPPAHLLGFLDFDASIKILEKVVSLDLVRGLKDVESASTRIAGALPISQGLGVKWRSNAVEQRNVSSKEISAEELLARRIRGQVGRSIEVFRDQSNTMFSIVVNVIRKMVISGLR